MLAIKQIVLHFYLKFYSVFVKRNSCIKIKVWDWINNLMVMINHEYGTHGKKSFRMYIELYL